MSGYKDRLKNRWQAEREGTGLTGQVVSFDVFTCIYQTLTVSLERPSR